jgi:hypothetical protein
MAEGDLKEILQNLRAIHDSAPPKPESEKTGKKEQADLQAVLLGELEIERKSHENFGIAQDIDERKRYAQKSFTLVSAWVLGVFLILMFQGFLSEPIIISTQYISLDLKFSLPDSVILAVVGGTTVSIISIFLAVVNYLFPKREK